MSQQTLRTALRLLTNQNILSKRVLMFDETFDILQLRKIFISNPQQLLIWIPQLGIQKSSSSY
jgi:hypothetical protein